MKLYLIKAVEEKNPEYFEHNLNLLKKFKFTDFEMKDTSRKITLDKQPQFKPSNRKMPKFMAEFEQNDWI